MSAQLLPEDLHHVLSRLPKDLAKLLRTTPKLILGGGFVRSTICGETVSDIDFFGPDKEFLKSVAQTFALGRSARFFGTDNAFTVLSQGRHTVQFIHRWVYDAAEKLIQDFDFSIAQAAVWFDPSGDDGGRWKSLVSDVYYADLASKRLRYLSPARAEDAGGSLLRMRKFIKRGYHIEAPSMARVIARAAMGIRQVQDHINEEHFGRVLTGLLREVDPFNVVDGLELVDEHQVIEDIGKPDAVPAARNGLQAKERAMLILTRRVGETVMIGEDVTVTVLGVKGNQVRIGVNAPKTTPVHREEIYDRIKAEQAEHPVAAHA